MPASSAGRAAPGASLRGDERPNGVGLRLSQQSVRAFLVEAMAAGCLVIGSDTTPVRVWVCQQHTAAPAEEDNQTYINKLLVTHMESGFHSLKYDLSGFRLTSILLCGSLLAAGTFGKKNRGFRPTWGGAVARVQLPRLHNQPPLASGVHTSSTGIRTPFFAFLPDGSTAPSGGAGVQWGQK